jgi:hypothetical protein
MIHDDVVVPVTMHHPRVKQYWTSPLWHLHTSSVYAQLVQVCNRPLASMSTSRKREGGLFGGNIYIHHCIQRHDVGHKDILRVAGDRFAEKQLLTPHAPWGL